MHQHIKGDDMNLFDISILHYLNQFSQQSKIIDSVIQFLSGDHLLKGGVLIAIYWWAWFKTKDHNDSTVRIHIVSTLFSSILAIALARLLQLTLPFRARPMHDDSLHFVLPYGGDPANLDDWSSFPSDHAALFFSLATGLLFISRKLGIFALLYTIVLISLPRIYLGLHYPTDIIAGALIGITMASIANIYLNDNKYLKLIKSWSYDKPALFYPLFFLLTHQIVDLFESVRGLGENVAKFIQIMAS
jgi:undecaprenyl-diphosphatase